MCSIPQLLRQICLNPVWTKSLIIPCQTFVVKQNLEIFQLWLTDGVKTVFANRVDLFQEVSGSSYSLAVLVHS